LQWDEKRGSRRRKKKKKKKMTMPFEIIVKVWLGSDLRRFSVDSTVSFSLLCQKVRLYVFSASCLITKHKVAGALCMFMSRFKNAFSAAYVVATHVSIRQWSFYDKVQGF
jgi:hypothetical protein